MARIKTPTVLHLPSHRPANPYEPKSPVEAPPVPAHLAPDERAAWHRFAATALKMRVLTADDWAALEHLACSYAEARRYRAVLRKQGRTYTTVSRNDSTMIRPRPEVAMLRTVNKELVGLYARFGLTPADRTNVKARPDPTTDPDAGFAGHATSQSTGTNASADDGFTP
jgi:P27 family predicted phage terminase small subunit